MKQSPIKKLSSPVQPLRNMVVPLNALDLKGKQQYRHISPIDGIGQDHRPIHRYQSQVEIKQNRGEMIKPFATFEPQNSFNLTKEKKQNYEVRRNDKMVKYLQRKNSLDGSQNRHQSIPDPNYFDLQQNPQKQYRGQSTLDLDHHNVHIQKPKQYNIHGHQSAMATSHQKVDPQRSPQQTGRNPYANGGSDSRFNATKGSKLDAKKMQDYDHYVLEQDPFALEQLRYMNRLKASQQRQQQNHDHFQNNFSLPEIHKNQAKEIEEENSIKKRQHSLQKYQNFRQQMEDEIKSQNYAKLRQQMESNQRKRMKEQVMKLNEPRAPDTGPMSMEVMNVHTRNRQLHRKNER